MRVRRAMQTGPVVTPNPLRGVTNKAARQLLQEVQDLGYKVTLTKGGHVRVDTPNGPYFTGTTMSDHRGIRALRAGLRQKGVSI